ncbi:MAG: PqqD family protein, partial [Byssovorax sp.]
MMDLTDSYEPAGQDIVSEEIDGEVIIVNLRNGNYYSLTQSATVIWSRIVRGETLEQIQGVLRRRYLGEAGVMQQGLTDLIGALETEELIRRVATES